MSILRKKKNEKVSSVFLSRAHPKYSNFSTTFVYAFVYLLYFDFEVFKKRKKTNTNI